MADKKFGGTHEMRDFDLKDKAHMADGTESPPRLSEALIHAMPKSSETTLLWLGPKERYITTMRSLFKLVYDRLDTGLEEAWTSDWGYAGPLDDSPQERWARMFAEMFVFTAYLGVAQTLRTKESESGEWDMKYVKRIEADQTDPIYPPFGACQHIANYMVVTQGFPSASLGVSGLGAGTNKNVPCFKPEYGGAWHDAGTRNIPLLDQELAKKSLGLTPGSMFCFDKPAANVHIGGALRVSDSRKQFQPMDTGVLAGMDDTGTADHAAKDYVNSGLKTNFAGVGILKKTDPPSSYIDFLATARPLGFAHFVVVDTDMRARYISRALPMYYGQKGFAVSRYVWSLRCLPLYGQAFWILSTSGVETLSVALAASGARDTPLTVLAEGAKDMLNGTLLHVINVLGSTRSTEDPQKGIVDNGNTGAGVNVYRRKYKGKDEWARYRGGESPFSNTSFPGDLSEVHVNWNEPLMSRWKAMRVDEEFTRPDFFDSKNPQITDLTAGVTYFSGAPAPKPAT